MFIIVGLGNPGRKYENTRHNLGFITLDRLSEKTNISIRKIKFKSLIGEGIINGEKVVLVKPQTFMNNSGEAVREIMDFYKEETSNLMVIYDDVDIPIGDIRIRMGGSGGTHNGMRSIIYQLGADDFPRIRIGIKPPEDSEKKIELMNYVLGGFAAEEVKPLEDACDNAVSAVISYIGDGIEASMNRFNSHKKKNNQKQDEVT